MPPATFNDALRNTALDTFSQPSQALLEADLQEVLARLNAYPAGEHLGRACAGLEAAQLMVGLQRQYDAWCVAHRSLATFLADEQWQLCAQTAEVIYLCEQDDALPALGQGIWLAVTLPDN